MMQIGLSLGIRYWKELFIGAMFFMSIVFLFFFSWAQQQVNQSCGGSSSTAAGPPVSLTGNGNIQQAWNFFTKYYSKSAAAGLMGNLLWESGGALDPNVQQGGMGNSPDRGMGIAQWTFNGRWQDLVRYSNTEGLNPLSLEAQLNYVHVELSSGTWGNYGAAFNSMSVTQATQYVEANYEVAGKPHMTERMNYAQQSYNQFAGSSTTATTTTSTQPMVTNTCSQNNLPALPASQQAAKVIKYEEQFLGVPYVWGGTTPSGFDCSGLQMYSFKNALGINLPRLSQDQQLVGTRIPPIQVQPGDLVFMGFPAFHVGMYIGNGKWIEAPQTGDVVKIVPYNPAKFTSAARILN